MHASKLTYARAGLEQSHAPKLTCARAGLEQSQVLSQVICYVGVDVDTDKLWCKSLRSVTARDLEVGKV